MSYLGDRSFDQNGVSCTASASLATTSFDAGYDGYVTLKLKYKYDEVDEILNYWKGYFAIDVDDDRKVLLWKYSNSSSSYTWNLWSYAGATNYVFRNASNVLHYDDDDETWYSRCYDSSGNRSVTVSRPKCPTTTTLGVEGTFYPWDTSVVLDGTVDDNGCEDLVSHIDAVQIDVSGPGVTANSPDIDVSNDGFSWTSSFPFPNLGHYGKYTATASYSGENNDHPIQAGSDAEEFWLELVPGLLTVARWIAGSTEMNSRDVPRREAISPSIGIAETRSPALFASRRRAIKSVSRPVNGAG